MQTDHKRRHRLELRHLVVLAEVSEAELSAPPDDDTSGSIASDSAGSVHGSEHDSVDSVTIYEIIMGNELAEWAWANTPHWLTPEKRQEYVDMFLLAAEICQKWEPGEGSNMMALYDIDETNEGDGEEAATA